MLKASRVIFSGLVVAYGVLVALFYVGILLIPDTLSVMALFATIAPVLLIGAVILLPIVLIVGQPRRSALALLPAVGFFVMSYGSQFIPSRLIAAEGEDSLRVMTYNLLFRESDYQEAVAVIRAADVDMVAIQELAPAGAQILRDSLSDEYPYMALNDNSNGYIGVGFLSRYPIVESLYLKDSFGNQRIEVDVDGTPVVFYNMHAAVPQGWGKKFLTFDVSKRTSDVTLLLERVAQETERVIVLGDFNMSDMSDNYQAITQVLTDTYRQVGWGMGWTHAGPFVASRALFNLRVLRLDYIFVQPVGLQILDAQVWHDSGGSDHLPVVARLKLDLTEH